MKSDSEGVDIGPHGSAIFIEDLPGDTNKINKIKYSLYDTEDYMYDYESEDEESEDDTEDYMYEDEDEDSKDNIGYNNAIKDHENEVREIELAIAKRYRKTEESSKVVDEDKEYLIFKKQFDLLSTKIKSPEDSASLIDGKEIVIVGVFPEFIGEEFENFIVLAYKLQRFYSFAYTHDAKILPGGEAVDKPTLRLFQPFDKRFVDSQDFQVDIMKKFIEEATTPVLTVWNDDPKNQPYIHKFLHLSKATAMLFVSFSNEHDLFQPKYKEIAEFHKGKGISFMLCDADVIRDYSFREFGVKKEQAPVLVIGDADGKKYRKEKIEPSQIESWMNDYMVHILFPDSAGVDIGPHGSEIFIKNLPGDTNKDFSMMSGSTSNLGPPQGSQIYINYLPIGTKSKHITKLCKHFGRLFEMEISDRPHHCNALVTFYTKDAAKKAVADLHKKEYEGKQLCCTLSTPSNLLFLSSIPTGMTESRLEKIISKMGRGFKKLKKFGLDPRNQPYNYAIVKYHNMDCAKYSMEKMLEQHLELDGEQTLVIWFHPGLVGQIPYLTQEEKKKYAVYADEVYERWQDKEFGYWSHGNNDVDQETE